MRAFQPRSSAHPTLGDKRYRTAGALLICLSLGLGAAACGGSSSSTSSSSSSAAAPASNASAEVEAASKVIAKYKPLPTTIPQQTPLNSKPSPEGTFVYTQCEEFSTCKIIGDAAVEAAKAVGWKTKVISYSSANPATLVAAMRQALLYKPKAVALTGLPEAAWAPVIAAYKAAKVPIITAQVGPQKITETVIANIYTPADAAVDANILANWMVVDSKGKASAVVQNVPGFPVLGAFTPAFKESLAKACTECKATSVDSTIQQVANASQSNGVMTSAVERTSGADYAVSTDMLLNAGLPAALQTSGLSNVKVVGALATASAISEMLAGRVSAMTAQPYQYQGWSIVDAALRHSEGMPISEGNGGVPHQLLLKENVGKPAEVTGQPPTFREQFKALWKLG